MFKSKWNLNQCLNFRLNLHSKSDNLHLVRRLLGISILTVYLARIVPFKVFVKTFLAAQLVHRFEHFSHGQARRCIHNNGNGSWQ